MPATKTIFETNLSDTLFQNIAISKQEAASIFYYFKNCPLFRWQDANNDCEDRANAITLLLDKWGIPNYKAWVFSGAFLKREAGSLVNLWNYHVAAALPVIEENTISYYVIDPATLVDFARIDTWADNVTDTPFSYHLVKYSCYYIFNPANFSKEYWHTNDQRNFKWTMQGLAGVNGVSQIGKAQLVFNKKRIKKAEAHFNELLRNRPTL